MSKDTISFINEMGEEEIFRVIEQTRFNGNSYLLTTAEDADDDEEVWLFRQAGTQGEEVCYELLEDDKEIEAVLMLFEAMLNEEE